MAQRELPARRNASVMEDRRAPDVAIVEPDHPEAKRRELLTEPVVPEKHLRRETHHQQQRRGAITTKGLVTEPKTADTGEQLTGRGKGHTGRAHGPERSVQNAKIDARAPPWTAGL